ncbi:MYXO-CTERM sorting domain-containing protein [Saccharomonospora piscinae]|uniref:MYXO-CTERM sorting domain-containing protein n=1 Tax=Saccharomonospora piscinae TaxID=687388 RepID=UPI001105EA85|nr:MYXO-CTERM sorting domain-containing protein [Saccharomonospora piscinae]TLW95190.1 hypothetical protein FFT09_04950 [Saccharomonospora piscinae]
MPRVTGGRMAAAVCVLAPLLTAAQSAGGDSPAPWGLLGLLGLVGLAGQLRVRRRRRVVADPFDAYPVMRGTSAQDAVTPPHGISGVANPVRPAHSAAVAPVIPAQSRSEQQHSGPWPAPAGPRPEVAPGPVPTVAGPSTNPDGSIRLAPAPPLHARRLTEPNLDISGTPGGPGAAEPRWPQRDYY